MKLIIPGLLLLHQGAAVGNFCRDQSKFDGTALTANGTPCAEYVAIYERASLFGITSWTAVDAAKCASTPADGGMGTVPLKLHLSDQVRTCCGTDFRTVCDIGRDGNFCKDQSKFNPAGLSASGRTCADYVSIYERTSLFDITSWVTVDTTKCEQTAGGHTLSAHLESQNIGPACCSDEKEVCDPGPNIGLESSATVGGPTSMLGAFIVAAAAAMHR